MTRKICVEFRYFDKNTCSRCRITDENVEKTMSGLQKAFKELNINIDFKTTKLPASRLAESNSILINEVDIEEIINGKNKKCSSICHGCATLINSPCNCRTYLYKGKNYRYIPKTMIKEAINKIAKVKK